ncbi:MAG: DUF3021 domain-containing protein [Lactococcus lactis]|jgi:Fe2+ transport system protein B|nr:DUF3021 domain-containing protein [Enterococcus faecium]MDN6390295.1 DUF3021 domain-containing protein [Lactococcus lactis]
MKYIKKIISGAFIGVGIGFTLNLIFSIINGEYYPGVPSFLEKYDSTLMAVTVQTLIYMLLGIIQAFSTDIMNNQKRSLLSNTIIHFSIIFLPLLVVAYILHWGRDLLGLLSVGFSILVVYFIIWIVSYLGIKSQIDKINQSISKKK